MTVSIAIETPLQDDVRTLIDGLNDHLLPLSPLEFQFKMSAEQMAEADTTVFVAREDGVAIGVGALKNHGLVDGVTLGEVKRMFTLPAVRGNRVGVALLEAILAEAVTQRQSKLVLETGVGAGFAGAHRLYERRGFAQCGVVLDYPDSAHSRFYEKAL